MVEADCVVANLLVLFWGNQISWGLKNPVLHFSSIHLVSKTFRLTENSLLSYHLGLLHKLSNIIEAFSPGVEKRFSSTKFLVDLSVSYAKRGYTHQGFSTRKTCVTFFQPRGWMFLILTTAGT